MGFAKYANASVVTASINMGGWNEVRAKANSLGPAFGKQAKTQVMPEFKADQFLLSHCTIIASVDTELPGGDLAVLGKQMYDGVQIDRRYSDFYITEATTKYANNNHDAWERKLLMASFPTFVGGENYVEHVQIPELSKGKIIDAAARDIGDSIYVDILVATNRKHRALIEAIESGALSTLSMGAQVAFTICTKCGNRAEDELQLCKHIKYQKGNFFFDTFGRRRKIVELCGHISEEPGSCKFIEGSWVGNPAFPGAVLRNILDPEISEHPEMARRMQVAFSQPTRTMDPNALAKAAHLIQAFSKDLIVADDIMPSLDGLPSHGLLATAPADSAVTAAELKRNLRYRQIKQSQDQAPAQDGDFGFGGEEQESPAPEEDSSFDKSVKDVKDKIVEKAKSQIQEELAKGEQDDVRQTLDENQSNESLIKSALALPEWKDRARRVVKMASGNLPVAKKILAGMILFERGGWKEVASARRFTGSEILGISKAWDRLTRKASMAGEGKIYSTVVAVGGIAPYVNENAYLSACRQVMGRDLTDSERIHLVFKGHLFGLGL